MRRRRFIQYAGLAVASGIKGFPPASFGQQRAHPKELNADLIVIGGGIGGCAAALAAVRNGRRVILTEETDWIGGQLTQQAVPPDEHPWIEIFSGTRSYRNQRLLLPQLSSDTPGGISPKYQSWQWKRFEALPRAPSHPHHQWLLPAAPSGMEYWRVGGPACGLRSEAKERPTPDSQSKTVAFRFSDICPRPGSRNRVVQADTPVAKPDHPHFYRRRGPPSFIRELAFLAHPQVYGFAVSSAPHRSSAL